MTDKNELASKLRELQALIGEEKVERQPLVKELWSSWSTGMAGLKSKATVDSIHNSWKHLEPIIGAKTVDEITGETWTNKIIPEIRRKTHSGIKFANDRKWLSMFLKWCMENGKGPRGWQRPRLVDPDPVTAPGRSYREDETNRLYENADVILYPKLVMALEHFMRRSEIALLSKDRVDRENRIIHLRAEDTKIRKARSFPYNERLENALTLLDREHRLKNIDSPWVFPSPSDPKQSIGRGGFSTAWETCRKNSRVIGKFHWLRHTALTRAFRAPGANHALICHFAGLDLAMAMKVYVHIEIEDMRGVLK